MNYSKYLGIDISKRTLDVCLLNGKEVELSIQVKNEIAAIENLFSDLQEAGNDVNEILICAEHTGPYSYPLTVSACNNQLHFWLENATEIKMRSGLQRGKNDKVDAERIARYAERFNDRARLYESEESSLKELSFLSSERESLIMDRAKYKAQIKDRAGFMDARFYEQKAKRLERLIRQLNKEVKRVEQQMNNLIKSTPTLDHQYNLLLTIDGVGKQVALHTLIATKGFTKFKTPRKFACHTGVAPFAYMSGSSQKSRWKVSHKANKKLKSLFHMAALSAIQTEGHFKEYFLRKVAEGKNKMTVINAVRSKIIHRMFAVIKNQTEYDKNYSNPLGISIR